MCSQREKICYIQSNKDKNYRKIFLEAMQVKRQWNNIFKVLKAKTLTS